MRQVPGGQLVHPVAAPDTLLAPPGIEIEADDHRIVDRRDVDAVAGQHVEIVLDVLPDLEDRLALQQRPEQGERRGPVDLLGLLGEHVGPAVGQRHVAGVVGAKREADPDQLGLHRVEQAGLGIDRHLARSEGAGDPVFEPLARLHAFIGGEVDRRHRGQLLPVAAHRGRRGGMGRRILGLGRMELGLGPGRGLAAIETLEEAGETVLGEEGGERRLGHGLEREIVERDRQRAILLELDQPAREARHLGLLDQALAQLARLHRRRGGEHGLEAAVLLDQLGRGLRADPADPGDIVDRVAHQRQHIADQLGRHAELLDHLGNVDPLVLHRVEHVDAAARLAVMALGAAPDELHQVLVRRDDSDVPAAPGGLARIGGDEVVRLEPLLLDAGEAEGPGRVADQRELRHQVLGRRGAVGLVLVVEVVAERGPGLVEDHREVSRPVGLVEVLGELPQHRGVAIDRAHRHALRVGERGQAVIGAEDVGRAVDQVEMLLGVHACLPITATARRQSRAGETALHPRPIGGGNGAATGRRRKNAAWPARP